MGHQSGLVTRLCGTGRSSSFPLARAGIVGVGTQLHRERRPRHLSLVPFHGRSAGAACPSRIPGWHPGADRANSHARDSTVHTNRPLSIRQSNVPAPPGLLIPALFMKRARNREKGENSLARSRSWSKKRKSCKACWFAGFGCVRNRTGRIRTHEPSLMPHELWQARRKRGIEVESAINAGACWHLG